MAQRRGLSGMTSDHLFPCWREIKATSSLRGTFHLRVQAILLGRDEQARWWGQGATAGCECVAHILESMTDLDHDTTIIFTDGVGSPETTCSSTWMAVVRSSPFYMVMGGRDGHHTAHPTRGRRGARCSLHINALRIRQHGSLVATG